MRLSEISDNDVRAAIPPSLSQRRIVGYPRISICEWLARQVAELRDNKSVCIFDANRAILFHLLSGMRHHHCMALVSISHTVNRLRVSEASHS